VPTIDPGSYRDREGRVFFRDGRVFRALSPTALADWNALSGTAFFQRAMAAGQVITTAPAEVSDEELATLSHRWVAALEHERIPFITYPYEWCFGMLRDAALLHLDLLLGALAEGLILKDSSAFNIQWKGARPVHIDVPSFRTPSPGEPWVGYLQFCQQFLYPLMLMAYKNVPFQPWFRGAIDGITPAECQALMSFRDHLRPGVLTHVYLQSRLQARTADASWSLKKELGDAGFQTSLIVSNARRLRRLVERLRWKQTSSEWSDYASEHSYGDEDEAIKREFVRSAADTRHWSLVWDLGCNTGEYSTLVADRADTVVAMDGDQLAVERLYSRLRSQATGTIVPLVMNLSDPSPDLGWRGEERRALTRRGKPDLTLCLALIHHMVIGANIPLDEFVDWLASLESYLVLEFINKEDAMVKKLLLNKEDIYDDYAQETLERSLARHFVTLHAKTFHGDTRVLYFLRPHDA